MLTSGSGMGKTQFLREIKNHYHETTDFKFADIALEEDVGDSVAGLVSLRLNKRITLPDVTVDPDEERAAFDYYFSSGRWTGYDYFGGLDDDNLFSKIRFFAATGHKFIFLDHLSIIVSEYAAEGGERERIDTIMTKLAKLVKELNITIFLIVHLKKTSQGTSFEEGATPSLDDLRGSGTLKQLSMTVIALSRNQQHEDPFCANTSKITVLKCRFTGRTGTTDYLNFNDKTGRMVSIPCPTNYEPERRGSGNRSQISAGSF
jgi:twinkle protein